MKKRDVVEHEMKVMCKNYNLYERIVMKVHYKIFIKFYNEIRVKIVNVLSD